MIFAQLDPRTVKAIACCSRGANESVEHFKSGSPDWDLVERLHQAGIPCETERVRQIRERCNEIWKTEGEGWDQSVQPLEEEIKALERAEGRYSATATAAALVPIGLFIGMSLYSLASCLVSIPTGYLRRAWIVLAVGALGSWKLCNYTWQKAIDSETKINDLELQWGDLYETLRSLPVSDYEYWLEPLSDYPITLSRFRENQTPLGKLQHLYSIDDLCKKGAITKNQYVLGRVLITLAEDWAQTWLEKAQSRRCHDLLGDLVFKDEGWVKNNPSIVHLVSKPEDFPYRLYRHIRQEPSHKLFNRSIIAEEKLRRRHCIKRGQYYWHPLYGTFRDW